MLTTLPLSADHRPHSQVGRRVQLLPLFHFSSSFWTEARISCPRVAARFRQLGCGMTCLVDNSKAASKVATLPPRACGKSSTYLRTAARLFQVLSTAVHPDEEQAEASDHKTDKREQERARTWVAQPLGQELVMRPVRH